MCQGFGGVNTAVNQGVGLLNNNITEQGYQSRLQAQQLASQQQACCCEVKTAIEREGCANRELQREIQYQNKVDELNQSRAREAVLANQASDDEGIINYTTSAVYVGDTVYTAEQYCSRIAGIIAGTPLDISATYAPLNELTDCTRLTKAEMDAAVDAGNFIVWFDGEKVKTARAVNSLTTLTSSKNKQFQKIKIVDIMDMIANDIRMTAEDNYLGKYANSYANKGLLISAIGNYFDGLKREDLIQSYKIGIDVDANRAYLKGKGVDVDSMSDAEIMKANTGSYVYLKATLSILDAIEDIVLPITI
jgi:hypothetical protein